MQRDAFSPMKALLHLTQRLLGDDVRRAVLARELLPEAWRLTPMMRSGRVVRREPRR